MKKSMNKTTKNNFITYAMVIAIFVVVQILSSTGNLSRLAYRTSGTNLCVYHRIFSLNLVVGYSGRAEPWTCRFYVRRSLLQCPVFTYYQ